MAKKIDITEKLSFEESPVLQIKELEIKVNSDAATILKVIGIMSENGNPGAKDITQMCELLFDKEERQKLDSLKLNMKDFTTVIHEAIDLVTGKGEQGE